MSESRERSPDWLREFQVFFLSLFTFPDQFFTHNLFSSLFEISSNFSVGYSFILGWGGGGGKLLTI